MINGVYEVKETLYTSIKNELVKLNILTLNIIPGEIESAIWSNLYYSYFVPNLKIYLSGTTYNSAYNWISISIDST